MDKIILFQLNEKISQFIKVELETQGYETILESNANELINVLEEQNSDLIIIDMDTNKSIESSSLCRKLKKDFPHITIFLMFKKVNKQKFIRHYRLGADDFITKPVDMNLLLTRIKMHFAKQKKFKKIFKLGNLQINTQTYQVKRGKKDIDLTPQEFKLLKFLLQNKGKVLSRDLILSRVWSYDADVNSRVVDVYMGYLRTKIDENFSQKLIHTVRGFGYVLKKES